MEILHISSSSSSTHTLPCTQVGGDLCAFLDMPNEEQTTTQRINCCVNLPHWDGPRAARRRRFLLVDRFPADFFISLSHSSSSSTNLAVSSAGQQILFSHTSHCQGFDSRIFCHRTRHLNKGWQASGCDLKARQATRNRRTSKKKNRQGKSSPSMDTT